MANGEKMRKTLKPIAFILGILTILGMLGFDSQSTAYSGFLNPTNSATTKECTGRITRVQSVSHTSDALNFKYFEEPNRRKIEERREVQNKEQGLKKSRQVIQLPKTATAITRGTTCMKRLSALGLPLLARIDMLPLENRPPPIIS